MRELRCESPSQVRRAKSKRGGHAGLRKTRLAQSAWLAVILFRRMGIVKNIAAIAKGMSVTFGEMFKPTEVENYPDGPGPNRGAMFQERFRGMHVLQRDENGFGKCVACFFWGGAGPGAR